MRYAAVLTGQNEVFERLRSRFATDGARIRRLGEAWVLESTDFDSCKHAAEVFPIADALARRINCILALYAHLLSAIAVAYIQTLNSAGEPVNRSIRSSMTINVYSLEGMVALNLRGDQEMNWSRIYDVIEFFGGADEIELAGWASKKRTPHIRQTANHFRHLGSTKQYPLPAIPPTIYEARQFADDLLKGWMTSRL